MNKNKRTPAHLRIKVKTLYNGKLITKEDIYQNPDIASHMPPDNEVRKKYLETLQLASLNTKSYELNISEYGISITEFE